MDIWCKPDLYRHCGAALPFSVRGERTDLHLNTRQDYGTGWRWARLGPGFRSSYHSNPQSFRNKGERLLPPSRRGETDKFSGTLVSALRRWWRDFFFNYCANGEEERGSIILYYLLSKEVWSNLFGFGWACFFF